jgi:hypothetical protein
VGESGCTANLILSEGAQLEVVSHRVEPSSHSIAHGTNIHIPSDLQPAIAERMAAARGAIPAEQPS